MIEKELLKLSNKALKKKEIPVAAIIVYKNKIIAKAYNRTNKTSNPLDHAEIICIKKASKKLKNWRLNECNLYVTLFPCRMCMEVIKKARLNKVEYILENEQIKKTKIKISNRIVSSKIKNILKKNMIEIFKNKR